MTVGWRIAGGMWKRLQGGDGGIAVGKKHGGS